MKGKYAKMKTSLSPERFWDLYSNELNKEGKNPETYEFYKDTTKWTNKIKDIAGNVISDILSDLNKKSNFKRWNVQREYFLIDLIGYTTEWYNPDNKGTQHDWQIKVAYEHENGKRWDDELCKLCHVVADLKVLSSYHDFENKNNPIEDLLQKRVDRLGTSRLQRVPNSSWLFVFGPLRAHKYPFRAFTLDSELKVSEVTCGKRVIPNNWQKISMAA